MKGALKRAMRRDLLELLASAPEWEAERAGMLVRWLNGLAPGTRLAFYGCGSLAQRLAGEHPEVLTRHSIRFFTTTGEDRGAFLGFPRTSLAHVRQEPPERLVLLSAAFEWEMLQATEGIACAEVLTQRALVERSAPDSLLDSIYETIRAEAADLAGELARMPADGLRLGLAFGSLGRHALEGCREFKSHGFRVALLTVSSMEAQEALEKGWLDALHTVRSSEHLNMLLHCLLVDHHILDVVLTWTSLFNPPYLEDAVARSGTKTAFWCDAFVDLFFDDERSGRIVEEELGTTRAEYLEQSRRIYCGADVLFIKDAPAVQRLVEERLGCRPNAVSVYPYMSLETFDRPRPPRAAGPFRLALAQSIHRTRLTSVWFEIGHLFSLVEMLTAQGMEVTFFNASDSSGLGCEDFQALAEANPLFLYRRRVSPAALVEELRGFDLGLLEYSPGPIKNLPVYFAVNMQLKFFAYAEAGLPTLVIPELSFIHEFVMSRGLGLSCALNQMDGLSDRLRSFDFEGCRARLRVFCQDHDVRRQVQRQAGALLRLFDAPPAG